MSSIEIDAQEFEEARRDPKVRKLIDDAIAYGKSLEARDQSVPTQPAPSYLSEEGRNGVDLIAAERARQVEAEGWTPEHDDQHTERELARAAALYADPPGITRSTGVVPNHWPWDPEWWKPDPDDPIHNLVRAGALIAAEIDRLNRANLSDTSRGGDVG